MQIPHTELKAETLQAIVQEFVTRDGTDHSPDEQRVQTVMRQLENGEAELHFDADSETCNIVRR